MRLLNCVVEERQSTNELTDHEKIIILYIDAAGDPNQQFNSWSKL
jgi:hypothetical protein